MAYEYWYIDGINLTEAYGIYIERGTGDLLRLPQKKEGISHDWREANGREYDLDRIYVDERVTTFNIGMLADDEAAYWQQHAAFQALLTRPGLRRLEIATHPGKQYYFFYKEWGAVTQVLPLTGRGGGVGQKFTITICEPQPSTEAQQTQAIVDEDGRFLIS
jgi:hypothetical protein